MVDTNVAEIANLINTMVTITIPAILGLAFGIINFINHKTNSSKIHNVTSNASAALTKAQELDKRIAVNEDKITSGLIVAQDVSPAVKNAIVESHPKVIAIEAKVNDFQKKLDELNSLVTVANLGTETGKGKGNKLPVTLVDEQKHQ